MTATVDPITVRLHAAAREAAGESSILVPATAGGDVAALRDELSRRHGAPMERVLAVATLLVDGVAVPPGATAPLLPAAVVEVLPPFAGG